MAWKCPIRAVCVAGCWPGGPRGRPTLIQAPHGQPGCVAVDPIPDPAPAGFLARGPGTPLPHLAASRALAVSPLGLMRDHSPRWIINRSTSWLPHRLLFAQDWRWGGYSVTRMSLGREAPCSGSHHVQWWEPDLRSRWSLLLSPALPAVWRWAAHSISLSRGCSMKRPNHFLPAPLHYFGQSQHLRQPALKDGDTIVHCGIPIASRGAWCIGEAQKLSTCIE